MSKTYYLIFEHTGNPITKRTTPSFIVESKDVAEYFCKEFYQFYYEERNIDTTCASLNEISDDNPFLVGLYKDIECPVCKAKHFEVFGTLSTAVYNPTIISNGQVTNDKNTNVITENCKCLSCGTSFNIVNGKVECL